MSRDGGWLEVVILVIALGAFFVAFFGYWRSKMAKEYPEEVLRSGRWNVWVMMAGIVAVTSLIAAPISWMFEQPFFASMLFAGGVLIVGQLVWTLLASARALRKAGAVLLDCGPYPQRLFHLLTGIGMLLFMGVGGLNRLLAGEHLTGLAGMMLGGSTFLGTVLFLFGRLQLREGGVWSYGMLMPWEKVESFYWNENMLIVRRRPTFLFSKFAAFPVPGELKGRAEEIMRSHAQSLAGSEVIG